jgi:hypothetical protein
VSVPPPPDLEAPLELSILSLTLAEFESLDREEERDKVLFFSPPLFVPLVLFPKLFNEDFFISCFLGVLIGLK